MRGPAHWLSAQLRGRIAQHAHNKRAMSRAASRAAAAPHAPPDDVDPKKSGFRCACIEFAEPKLLRKR
jgi:hypothetical protein